MRQQRCHPKHVFDPPPVQRQRAECLELVRRNLVARLPRKARPDDRPTVGISPLERDSNVDPRVECLVKIGQAVGRQEQDS